MLLFIATLTLGSRPRQRACKGASQVEARESHFHAPESAKECGERTFTLPSELPLWELESQWTPKCSENDCKDQNQMTRTILYIIGKLLKHRCLKWARIGHLKHKLWPKERPKIKLTVWFLTTKVKNHPDFHACRWCATYHWKALDEATTLF